MLKANAFTGGVIDNLTVDGSFTSVGIDDNATSVALTISPSESLYIGTLGLPNGTSVYGSAFNNTGANGIVSLWQGTSTTAGISMQRFYNPNGNVGSIQCSGGATSYVTSSDPRLKSEFVDPANALGKIVEARESGYIGAFNFLSDPDTEVWGYNAHALIDNQAGFGGTEGDGPRNMALGEVYEEAVIDEEGNEVAPAKVVHPAGVDQSKRVPLLEAAIYDLLKRIEILESA